MAETKMYTPEGLKALQDELDYLVNVKVEENKKEISTARSFGDLSENSEYDAAKEEQGKIHARIAELREMIANAKIIDETQIDESKISVGSCVTVKCNTQGTPFYNKEIVYYIVGSYEADPLNKKISDDSPIGKALIGAAEGDVAVAVTAKGALEFEVLKVSRAKAKA